MSYCINPQCNTRPNEAGRSRCQSCGTSLLIGDAAKRYRLLRPLRPLDSWSATEIFEAELVSEEMGTPVTPAISDASAIADAPASVEAVAAEGETPDAASPDSRSPEEEMPKGEAPKGETPDAEAPSNRRVLKLLKQERLLPLFKQEAEALAQLNHPGIPALEPDGFFAVDLAPWPEPMYCLVMDYVEGDTLDSWLANHRPIKQKQAEDWLRQLAGIVQHLHQNSFFHRDIKLANLMRQPDGQLALIDFGTVQPITDAYLAQIGRQGELISGVSPGYTPPEQSNGKAVPQSDFYAVGRSLIHLLTGQHPAEFDTDADGHLHWRPSAPKISPKLAQLIDDLTAPAPGQRPTTADAILQRLDDGLRAVPNRALKPKIVGLVLLNWGLLLLHMFVFGRWYAAWQGQPSDSQTPDAAIIEAERAEPKLLDPDSPGPDANTPEP